MPWTNWLTDKELFDLWPDAPDDGEDEPGPAPALTMYNDAALAACEAFAPVGPEEDTPVPANFRLAQMMQARNLWNASKVDPDRSYGEGEFVVTVHPLDWQVKALLRPRRRVPVVG